ncbi:MAG: TRAM domain-containing protein [Candidatus Diapherotrites archaeon]|uniref:TRAM domain-containing protein n=1 Tax=Candidatus Iainarchaeum sp. TaxID=3101447 RepID=A0A8T4C5X3_9ARCH|nr:TRAM domain-containing protein [Candidatus Diapherotrites archaeon]
MHNNYENRPRRPSFGPVPVKEGDTYDVTIEGIGEKGDGIAKIQGFVIVVPKTQQGQRVKVRITAVRGKVSFGEVVGEATSEEPASDSMDEEEEQ